MTIFTVPVTLSLADAQAQVRRLYRAAPHEPLRVELAGGVRELTEPLTFTSDDSGTAACPITWSAAPGQRVVFSGGQRLRGWNVGTHAGCTAWTLMLPEVRAGAWTFTQLFVNDKRRPRTRLPRSSATRDGVQRLRDDEPFYRFVVPQDARDQRAGVAGFRRGDLDASWRNREDLALIALRWWTDFRLRLTRIDEASATVHLADASVNDLIDEHGEGCRYFVENVYEALDTPGQWYLDRQSGQLTYLPLPGEVPESTEVIAPRLPELVRFAGAHHIHLAHVDLLHAEFNHPAHDHGSGQAQFHLPAAVVFRAAEDNVLFACRIAHVNAYGVEVRRGSRRNQIVGCAFTDLGAGAVKIHHEGLHVRHDEVGSVATRRLGADPDDWEGEPFPADEQPASNTLVAHCTITAVGRVYPGACALWIGDAGGNQLLWNHIEDTYYTAISVGWTWGYRKSLARRNLIAGNYIGRIGQGLLSDMGAIYLLGVQPGTVVRDNWIEDVRAFGYGGGGIYPDEGSSFLVIERNVVHGALSGAFTQHYGRDNLVRGNVFSGSHGSLAGTARPERVRGFTAIDNVLLGSNQPLYGQVRACNLINNSAWNSVSGRIAPLPGLQEIDPGCISAETGDFRGHAGSPLAGILSRVPQRHQVGPQLGSLLPRCLSEINPAQLYQLDHSPVISVRMEAQSAAEFCASDIFDSDPQTSNRYPYVDASQFSPLCVVVDNGGLTAASGVIELSWDGAAGSGIIDGPTRLEWSLPPGGRAILETTAKLLPSCPGAWLLVRAGGVGNDSALWFINRIATTIKRLPAVRLSEVRSALSGVEPYIMRQSTAEQSQLRMAMCGEWVGVHAQSRDCAPLQGGQPWSGSLCEIFTSMPGTNGRIDRDGRSGNQQLFLVPAVGDQPAKVLAFGPSGVLPVDGVELASCATAEGWELWALIPFAVAKLHAPLTQILFEATVTHHLPSMAAHVKTAISGDAAGHDNGSWMLATIS